MKMSKQPKWANWGNFCGGLSTFLAAISTDIAYVVKKCHCFLMAYGRLGEVFPNEQESQDLLSNRIANRDLSRIVESPWLPRGWRSLSGLSKQSLLFHLN